MRCARALAFNFAFFGWTAILGTIGLPFLAATRAAANAFRPLLGVERARSAAGHVGSTTRSAA